jgi:hypothetical protein
VSGWLGEWIHLARDRDRCRALVNTGSGATELVGQLVHVGCWLGINKTYISLKYTINMELYYNEISTLVPLQFSHQVYFCGHQCSSKHRQGTDNAYCVCNRKKGIGCN